MGTEEKKAFGQFLDKLQDAGVVAGNTLPAPPAEEPDDTTYQSFVTPSPVVVTDLRGHPISNEDPEPKWSPSHGSSKKLRK
jgi:hypothetical protein